MEYLLIKFQESRGVIVDGISEGMTNQALELETGDTLRDARSAPRSETRLYETSPLNCMSLY